MSLVRCRVQDCTHRVREGLRRYGRGGRGQPLADGEFCWRCRAKQARARTTIRVRCPKCHTEQPQVKGPGPLKKWSRRFVCQNKRCRYKFRIAVDLRGYPP